MAFTTEIWEGVFLLLVLVKKETDQLREQFDTWPGECQRP